MKKEYVTFVTDIDDLVQGQEVQLTIRDLSPGPRKYDARVVRAVVSSSAAQLPQGDVLRVRSWTGALYPQPWAIQITEELGECLPGRPHGETVVEG
ncbi:MAG: phenylphosphate carboxylase subunit gamma [Dehalococcoidia bacterium]